MLADDELRDKRNELAQAQEELGELLGENNKHLTYAELEGEPFGIESSASKRLYQRMG